MSPRLSTQGGSRGSEISLENGRSIFGALCWVDPLREPNSVCAAITESTTGQPTDYSQRQRTESLCQGLCGNSTDPAGYEPALEKSNDAEKNRLIHNKANDELKKNLAKQNLTIEQYNRIFNQVNSSEQLRQKTLKAR